MFDIERWKEIISALRKNKLRSFLTAFGVFWGILMLIIMSGAGKGLEYGITEGVGELATNSFFMWTNRTSEPYKGLRRGRRWNYENEDVELSAQLDSQTKDLEKSFGTEWFRLERLCRL